MGDLITGAKLKHIDHTEESIEYELTPYEMLMEEIRARKYELNKVFTRCLHCKKIGFNRCFYILYLIITCIYLGEHKERQYTSNTDKRS